VTDEEVLVTDRGHVEATTWGEVAVGHIVRDQKDRFWTVVDERDGWLRLLGARTGESSSIKRPAGDTPTWIYVPSESEMLNLVQEELGARIIRLIEEREHTISRQKVWRQDPIPRNAHALQNHLDMLHGVNVDDVLRKWRGTEVKPSGPGAKKKALDELCELHDETHSDPHLWPAPWPHHHAGIEGPS
jgi:hypothetical protein